MGEDLDQEENHQKEVDIAEDFGEESDSSIPSHIEINDIEKTVIMSITNLMQLLKSLLTCSISRMKLMMISAILMMKVIPV